MDTFDLKKFLVENKVTRNSLLLENDSAPSFTNKEMKFFDPKQVKWEDNFTISYKGHKYELEVENTEVTERAESIGYADTYTDKLPGITFEFGVTFGPDQVIEHVDELIDIKIDPVWEIDPNSDEIPDEEEFDFEDDDILNEIAIVTDYQFTPEQLNLLKSYGVKQSTSGRELYIPPSVYDALQLHASKSNFKQDFIDTFSIKDQSMASQILTAIKKSLSGGNNVKINDKIYYVLKGHLTKNNNFNFPNPFRKNKSMNEITGPELVNTISMIGGTLSKIEQMMDFGVEQSPETIKGLDTALNILLNIQSELESERRAYAGPASDYQLENIIKRK